MEWRTKRNEKKKNIKKRLQFEVSLVGWLLVFFLFSSFHLALSTWWPIRFNVYLIADAYSVPMCDTHISSCDRNKKAKKKLHTENGKFYASTQQLANKTPKIFRATKEHAHTVDTTKETNGISKFSHFAYAPFSIFRLSFSHVRII